MGIFKRDGRTDPDGLDWVILQNGWTSLYWRANILNEDIQWFENSNYVIIEFNCKTWKNDDVMHHQLKEKFSFPDYYGENFNAFSDCLSDLKIIRTGLVIIFRHMDSINKNTAHKVLDIIADNARLHLLFGNRLITLVQVDDPDFEIEPVGKTSVMWNGKEWFSSDRQKY